MKQKAIGRLISFMLVLQAALVLTKPSAAQGLHFSQYYNAPMLVSPANTGLMSDKDYRVGVNYRNQWQSLPVPFNTFSLYGDLQLFRKLFRTNWLGIGGAMFTDRAGDGSLSLTRWEGFAAYHVELGEKQMISAGLSAASVERNVDISKLTFDSQWDGFVFNNTLDNGEKNYVTRADYLDVGAGINYAIFPNELVYLKIGASVAHLNQPKESFYNQDNVVGMRETGYVDMLARIGHKVVLNPSAYYTTQSGASELMFGTLFTIFMGGEGSDGSIVVGAYDRLNDAVIGTFGYEWSGLRAMVSYDYTMSQLGQYNNHAGALEFALRFQGSYKDNSAAVRRSYNCPRF